MKRLTIMLAAATVLSSQALAADPTFEEATYNWSGFYAGVALGYGSFDTTLLEGPAAGIPFGGLPQGQSHDGFLYGGTAGYNFQTGSWVYGVEVGFLAGPMDYAGPLGLGALGTLEVENVLTVGPRLGYALDRLLIYGEGGFGAAEMNIGITGVIQYPTEWGTGYFLGAGAEYAITDNLIFGGEYNFVDLGNTTLATPFGGGIADVIFNDLQIHTVAGRLTYKF